MAVRYLPIDGASVSVQWYEVLRAMRASGVAFHVNSGHRTMAQQTYFWTHQPPLAAFPSPTAPHIRTGRFDHAIDFNNASGVIHWLHAHGIPSARLTVPGESWHVEVDAGQLAAAAKKLGQPRTLHVGCHGEDVQRLQVLLRGVGRWPHKAGHTFGRRCKAAVVGYQRSQALKADGVYGPTTRKHLEADYYRKHPKP